MFAPYYYALNWLQIIFLPWAEGIKPEDFEDDDIIAVLWYFLEIMD